MFTKKIMTNAALFAVLGGVGIGASVPTFAAAGEVDAGKAEVSYEFVKGTPDDPSQPSATVKIKPSIKFDDTTKKVDASVELLNETGSGAYVGSNTFTVSVASTNGFKLQHEKGATVDDVDYKLTKADGSELAQTNTKQKLGEMTKTTPIISSSALLNGTATMDGNHTDQLVYTFVKA